jgi:hypothetical protein
VKVIHSWYSESVVGLGVSDVEVLHLIFRMEWHTHACRLSVDLEPPNLDHLLPSLFKNFTLNSDNHYDPHGLPGDVNSDPKNSDASNLGLIRSLNLMHNSEGGGRIVNYENFKKSTKNCLMDKLSIQIILDLYVTCFDSVIFMMLFLMGVSLHALRFLHYFLLQQHIHIHSS